MQGVQLETALGSPADAVSYGEDDEGGEEEEEEEEEEVATWWSQRAGALGPEDVRLELGGDEGGAGSVEPPPPTPPPPPPPPPPPQADACGVDNGRSGVDLPSDASNATQGAATRQGKRLRSVAQWSVQDVCQWLAKVFPRTHKVYAERFKLHDITGVVLLHLTERKLERIGLVEEQQRQQLMFHVLRLRLKEDMRNLQQSLRRPIPRPGTPASNS